MRVLSFHILLMAVLVAVITGCGGAHRYDGRLTAADSLMHDNPDSALAIIQAVCPDSLTTEGDRAYRDLLLTQARYKCYIVATSDSDINRALAYYRQHKGEREKLTRAYIYKGAVMDELGHPDSAMFYYKHAEATAAPDDYFNLGYSKMRMASLYQNQISLDSAAIRHYEDAILYFKLLNDTDYLITCYGNLGAVCGTLFPDSTEFYLNKAISLAQQINSPKQFTYKSKLAGYWYYNGNYRSANELAMEVFRHGRYVSNDQQFYYYATMSFMKMGLIDSAKRIFNATPPPLDAVDSMNYFDAHAEIAVAEKHLDEYYANTSQSKEKAIEIYSKSKAKRLSDAEHKYHESQAIAKEADTTKRNYWFKVATSCFLFLSVILLVVLMALKQVIKRKDAEKRAIVAELNTTIKKLHEEQNQNKDINGTVSTLVRYRIEAFNEILQALKFRIKGRHSRERSIIQLSSVVSELNDNFELMKIHLSDAFWARMKISVDAQYNGIASFVENNYPQLTPRDYQLFCLLCANLSPQIIRLCMNYTNVKSVTNFRSILIKKKMELNMSLEEYIDHYMDGNYSFLANNAHQKTMCTK